jgi:hypothetical protein
MKTFENMKYLANKIGYMMSPIKERRKHFQFINKTNNVNNFAPDILCYLKQLLDLFHINFLNYSKVFYVLLNVHLGIIFVNNQLDANFFFMYVYLYSLHVLDSHVLIIRRINYINTTSVVCHPV